MGACCTENELGCVESTREDASVGLDWAGPGISCQDIDCEPNSDCAADLTNDGEVGFTDLLEVISMETCSG